MTLPRKNVQEAVSTPRKRSPRPSIYDGEPKSDYKKEKGIPMVLRGKHALLTSQITRLQVTESILVDDVSNAMSVDPTRTTQAIRVAIGNAAKKNNMKFSVARVELGGKKLGVRIWRTE